MSNKYNNNKHDASPKDRQTPDVSEHGELRSGRLSVFKNHSAIPGEPENEYLDEATNSRGDH